MHTSRRWQTVVGAATALTTLCCLQAPAGAQPGHHPAGGPPARLNNRVQATQQQAAEQNSAASPMHTPDDGDLADTFAEYSLERSLPATSAPGAALVAARQQAAGMSAEGGAWTEVTTKPYNANPSGYTDPFWSNAGSGFSTVGGRTTALVTGKDGTWFAGTADGGVWRSTDQGAHWAPTFDGMPSLSIGALSVDPGDGALWVGTGEANTNSDSYLGTGVYRSTDGGKTYRQVGGTGLVSHTIYRIAFAKDGSALAATDDGLWRLASLNGSWTEVLAPAGANQNPPYANQVTDVQVNPVTGEVITVVGWRSASATNNYNGFFSSSDNGRTFSAVTPSGAIDASDIGRTTFAYAADGSKLYAIVQSPAALNAGSDSVIQGIFRSDGGSLTGPWTKIADRNVLMKSGSALYPGYAPGIQGWYNQALAVDPANPNHVYASLEEVYETSDAGDNWVTATPYWNYGLACGSSCPTATHPDQHALMLTAGKVVIGNDGGVYSRPLSDTQQYGDWTNLNATLRTLQYYDAKAGQTGPHALSYWGGLQDNGTSLLSSGASQMVEPAGGDGFTVIVDPKNGNRMVGEYTDLTMYSSTDGGHSFNPYVSPGCIAQETVGLEPRDDCDPNARFGAPFVADQKDGNTWVAGGEDVWVSTAGWNTTCDDSSCSWTKAFDTGEGNVVTALSSAGGVIYAAWVHGSGNPSAAFASGIATNYSGTWHQLDVSGLPNRYIAGITVDPANPAHAYAVYNGYSRRWIPGGGVGHVFETTNGGASWADIDTNLPDAPGDALLIDHGKLVLGTDIGVFVADANKGAKTSWARAGRNLPNASVNNVSLAPDGHTVIAATHGRGIWTLAI